MAMPAGGDGQPGQNRAILRHPAAVNGCATWTNDRDGMWMTRMPARRGRALPQGRRVNGM